MGHKLIPGSCLFRVSDSLRFLAQSPRMIDKRDAGGQTPGACERVYARTETSGDCPCGRRAVSCRSGRDRAGRNELRVDCRRGNSFPRQQNFGAAGAGACGAQFFIPARMDAGTRPLPQSEGRARRGGSFGSGRGASGSHKCALVGVGANGGELDQLRADRGAGHGVGA